ncbi:type VI secretion protein EvpB [Escherichia coli]|uniref:Type VI secretion protein EvpB n=1 Tax=Escherichia coli TaxID=562 RepID=A0A376MRK6_ECOLX|nr:type VI secretion protein EvpB [Escherichia coli]
MLQREQLGSWKERSDLERELNTWIRQYVADQENPPADVRSRKPLRAAKVEVMDVEGEPGWYQVALSVRPHFKFMGANFELFPGWPVRQGVTRHDTGSGKNHRFSF